MWLNIPLLVKSDEDALDWSRQVAVGDGRVTVKPFRSCPALLLLLALVLVLVQVLVLVLALPDHKKQLQLLCQMPL